MQTIIVNWVKEDEELLEPYEWVEHDDLEIISHVEKYHITESQLYDFIYGCITIKDDIYYNQVFAVSDTKYCVMVEIDGKGKLIFRSLVSFDNRRYINEAVNDKPITTFNYTVYDEGMVKEYGLTREERLKKQYIENRLDELYVEDYEMFLTVCKQLQIHGDKSITSYITLKKKLEKGYTFIHELLYNQLIKNK